MKLKFLCFHKKGEGKKRKPESSMKEGTCWEQKIEGVREDRSGKRRDNERKLSFLIGFFA